MAGSTALLRSETGASVYTFADGSIARFVVHPWLAVVITFADGTEVSVLAPILAE